ncbi:MAG TPA: S1C family serine protease [Rhodopila sp.]|nr:S1C family serine protease [Rhodopila sp.]
MTNPLTALSAAVKDVAAAATPLLAAIRVGPNRHLTGLVCQGDTILTSDEALPASDSYSVALPNQVLAPARPGPRDPACNLAALRLEAPVPAPTPASTIAAVGDLVIVLGAEADASPTVRLASVFRMIRTHDGQAPVLDLSTDRQNAGSLVFDPDGRLIGILTPGPDQAAMVIPARLLNRLTSAVSDTGPGISAGRRGWLGLSLQPIVVPDSLVPRAGQSSGRMVVGITRGGPADQAGLRVGDVLLSLNGTPVGGAQTLRAFLGSDRIGTTVQVKLLRDGVLQAATLTIAAQPG